MSSLKTTSLGILTIVAAIVGAAKAILTGATVDWSTAIAAVTSGIGLIMARDNNVTSEQAGAKN